MSSIGPEGPFYDIRVLPAERMAARATVSERELNHARFDMPVLDEQVSAQGRTVNVFASMRMVPETNIIHLLVELDWQEFRERIPVTPLADWLKTPFRDLDNQPRSTRLNEALIMAAEIIEDASRESQDAKFEQIVETLRRIAN